MLKFLYSLLLCQMLFCSYSAFAEDRAYFCPHSTNKITYICEKFTTHDGLTLHGHLALPNNKKGHFPAMLLLVGSGAINRYEKIPASRTTNNKPTLILQRIESALINAGIAVFTYDKRGIIPKDNTFLENTVSEDFQSAGAINLADDAVSAFDFLVNQPQIDKSRLSVLGTSEGTILALKVAEKRPEICSLFMLGILTRSIKEGLKYQRITNQMRLFYLMDDNHDGLLTEEEYNLFRKNAGADLLPTWEKTIKKYSKLGKNVISEHEWNFTLEQDYKKFNKDVFDYSKPWQSDEKSPMEEPRLWVREYYQEGPYLKRLLPFCSKIHIFQGEVDIQTPFEDALELREACIKSKAPLLSFKTYSALGHCFSPQIGFKKWRNTCGPMDSKVISDVVDAAVSDLKP